MKKINPFAANAIVGGGCKKVCTTEYASNAGGGCDAITTCQDKHGRVISKTTTVAPAANCPAPRP